MTAQYAWIALGGAIGAMGRFWVMGVVNRWFSHVSVGGTSLFPLGTLVVNVLGSFIMGCLFVLLVEKGGFSSYWRDACMIGGLGAFTTFSAFSMDVFRLLQHGAIHEALIYVAASVVICILAACTAVVLMRLIL